MERAEFRQKWLEALRSGQYQKTERTYFEENSGCMCTLGLGAHLLTGSTDVEVVVQEGLNQLFTLFPEINPRGEGEDVSLWSKVTNKNDNKDPETEVPPTFAEMADFLEEVLPA